VVGYIYREISKNTPTLGLFEWIIPSRLFRGKH
jgi:hypothetical protein